MNLVAGEVVFQSEECTNWLSRAKWVSPENIQLTLYGHNKLLFWNLCVYTNAHTCAITIDEKEAVDLKKSVEGCVGGLEGVKERVKNN